MFNLKDVLKKIIRKKDHQIGNQNINPMQNSNLTTPDNLDWSKIRLCPYCSKGIPINYNLCVTCGKIIQKYTVPLKSSIKIKSETLKKSEPKQNNITIKQRILSENSKWIAGDIITENVLRVDKGWSINILLKYKFQDGYINPYICEALFKKYLEKINTQYLTENRSEWSYYFGLEREFPHKPYVVIKIALGDEELFQTVAGIIENFFVIEFLSENKKEMEDIIKKWTPIRCENEYDGSGGWHDRTSSYVIYNAEDEIIVSFPGDIYSSQQSKWSFYPMISYMIEKEKIKNI